MHLAERAFDGCRIYAAALPAPGSSGHHSAVVVTTSGAPGQRQELFRDERLLAGRVWMDPAGALSFALDAGQAAITAQRGLRMQR